jgi:GTP-binding protein
LQIQEATYVGSYPDIGDCPKPNKPEYAFIGRSNVGKSSLINMLSGKKDLAHVSKKPGKTQMINFFLVNGEWYLVDLPGYGYAQRAKSMRKSWGKMITDYLQQRPTLQCAFVLIDANVPPQPLDLEFINWLGEEQIPFVLAFTKTDKLGKRQLEENLAAFRAAMRENWNELPQEFVTSSSRKSGKDEILSFIQSVNQRFTASFY